MTLTRESIAITERNYTRWEELRGEISAACDALQAIYAPAFCTRIGLRYQDILDPQAIGLESVPWSELLHPAIAGALGAEDEIGAAVMGFGGAVEIRIEDVAQGAVRLQYGLVQTPPNHPARFALDADFYSNERTPIDRVPEILDRFNHIAGNLFRWAITEWLATLFDRLHWRTSWPTTAAGRPALFEAAVGDERGLFFWASQPTEDFVKRVIGCALVLALPATGLDEAVQSLWEIREFRVGSERVGLPYASGTVRRAVGRQVGSRDRSPFALEGAERAWTRRGLYLRSSSGSDGSPPGRGVAGSDGVPGGRVRR